MAKKKMGRPRVEHCIRIVEVQLVQMYVSDRIDDRRNTYRPGGDAWLQIRGTCDEAIEGQKEIEISIHELGTDEKPAHDRVKAIGALIQLRPWVQVVLDMEPKLFDRTWTMAAGGQLRHVWISMTKPQKRHALVVSVSYQNEPIE